MISFDEESMMDKVLGVEHTWRGHPLWYCELCRTFSIGCKKEGCSGSSCNCGGCTECLEPFKEFCKGKTSVDDYLNDEEKKVLDKTYWIKKYLGESLDLGESEINWKRLKQLGKMGRHSEELFAKEIAESFAKQPDVKFGNY